MGKGGVKIFPWLDFFGAPGEAEIQPFPNIPFSQAPIIFLLNLPIRPLLIIKDLWGSGGPESQLKTGG